eukprot:Amastigsp_a676422_21.p2 type:complete len:149 gc:universal Amastigsp_a676422_21:475-921(+)
MHTTTKNFRQANSLRFRSSVLGCVEPRLRNISCAWPTVRSSARPLPSRARPSGFVSGQTLRTTAGDEKRWCERITTASDGSPARKLASVDGASRRATTGREWARGLDCLTLWSPGLSRLDDPSLARALTTSCSRPRRPAEPARAVRTL